jgi:peptide chain release factor 3
LEHEYGAKAHFRTLTYGRSNWVTSKDKKKLEEFLKRKQQHIGVDKDGNPVFLADNDFMINMTMRDYPDIEFHKTSEFK